MSNNTSTLFKPKQAAEMLNISLSTLYRLKDNYKLPIYRIGNSIRFSANDLNIFLTGCRKEFSINNYASKKN
jgi:excisionase family DNA binding protein